MVISRLRPVRRWLDGALLVLRCGLCFAPVLAFAQQPQDSDAPALERLAWMARNQRGMWNVNANEGAFLRDQAVKVKARRALEIGTSNGYSSIWIALGLRQTGGHLTTLEIDSARAKLAEDNFRAAGVESSITL